MPVEKEAVLADGSVVQVFDGGGSVHAGRLAVARFALIAAKHALIMNRDFGSEPTPGYIKHVAIRNISAVTGQDYLTSTGRLTIAGKRRALADCIAAIDAINSNAVVVG